MDSNKSKEPEPVRFSGNSSSPSDFPLVLAGEGEKVRIVSLRGGKGFQERLISMGLNVGDEIEVMHCPGRGAVVVAREGARYVLGGGMAQKIFVVIAKGGRYGD